MPISQNPKECGWFYHAPARKRPDQPRMDYPAPSNIPGIGFDDPSSIEKEEVKEMMFRETDSDYIRLAKMGGRKDLLAFNPDQYRRKKSAGAAGYARNEWYYLEDNRMEDEEKKEAEKKEWEFMLPEYMVHKSYKPSFEDPSTPTRTAAPYYTETTSVMKDEGRHATDKTVKIPETRRPGYGVRNEKPPPTTQKLPPRERAVKPQESENLQGAKKRNQPQVVMPTEKEDPTNMSKLLAGEYEREWYTKLSDVQRQQGGLQGSSAKSGHDRVQLSSGQHRREKTDPHADIMQRRRKQEEEEKEMFKMNRFKNIPSKIDSHQRPEILASVK